MHAPGRGAGTTLPVDVNEAALQTFCIENAVDALALFGSVLRDDFGPGSDVDIPIRLRHGRRVSRVS